MSIDEFAARHTSPMAPFFEKIARETHLRTLAPQMMTGAFQGKFLEMISQMVRPRRVLEFGTFTGYSACCLAAGLTEDGILHTIEGDEETFLIAKKNIENSPFSQKIKLHLGDAAEIAPQLDEVLDLVFLDAGKHHYAHHFDLVFEKIRPGGWLLADNVIWSGKLIDPKQTDRATEALRLFCEKIDRDPRVENLILPMRDGLMIVRKR